MNLRDLILQSLKEIGKPVSSEILYRHVSLSNKSSNFNHIDISVCLAQNSNTKSAGISRIKGKFGKYLYTLTDGVPNNSITLTRKSYKEKAHTLPAALDSNDWVNEIKEIVERLSIGGSILIETNDIQLYLDNLVYYTDKFNQTYHVSLMYYTDELVENVIERKFKAEYEGMGENLVKRYRIWRIK